MDRERASDGHLVSAPPAHAFPARALARVIRRYHGPMVSRLLVALALVALALPTTATAAEIQVKPGDDFCAAFNAAAPGDTVILAAGNHAGPCVLASGGLPGMPKTLRGADPNDSAVIVYGGQSSNVLDVLASDIVIADLTLGPSMANIDAIKIKDGSRITIESCLFSQTGGIAIAANSKNSDGVQILDNRFIDLQATGIYLGCHDGMASCAATKVVVAGNLFDGVDSSAVGYALEIKLDSYGVVRDNVIHDTKGPGIEIYGSVDLARVSVVERNLVIGSRTAGTLEIGGGPALVRNNIVVGGEVAGLSVYDYQNRGLVRAIQVVGNTVVGDKGPAILLSKWAEGKDLELTGNAAWQSAGAGPALPALIPNVPMLGNVDCGPDPALCWLDAAARDFWPADASPLLSDGAAPQLADPLGDDFCGQPRGAVPHVGALEHTMALGPGPLQIAPKSSFPCPQGDDTTGGDTTGDPDTTTNGTTDATTNPGTTSDTSGATTGDPPTTGDPDPSTGPEPSSSGSSSSSSGPTTATATEGLDQDDSSGCSCRTGQELSAIPMLALLAVRRRRRCCSLAVIFISRTNRAAPAGSRIVFTTTGRSSTRSIAENTRPMPPRASSSPTT